METVAAPKQGTVYTAPWSRDKTHASSKSRMTICQIQNHCQPDRRWQRYTRAILRCCGGTGTERHRHDHEPKEQHAKQRDRNPCHRPKAARVRLGATERSIHVAKTCVEGIVQEPIVDPRRCRGHGQTERRKRRVPNRRARHLKDSTLYSQKECGLRRTPWPYN